MEKLRDIKISIKYLIVLLIVVSASGCISMKLEKLDTYFVPIPKSSKSLDIPKYDSTAQFKGYPYVYWNFCKQKQNQLGLTYPETSNDSLIYRVWITNPVGRTGQPHALIELKYDSTGWNGSLTLMRVDFKASKLSETITNHKVVELKPLKTNWTTIIDSLYKLKFDILPTDEKIPNYYTESNRYANNEPTFSFEYATKNEYRFYQYSNIYRDPENFWQPKNIIDILDIFEEEFKWDTLAREYF
jgi:hypothetical protein